MEKVILKLGGSLITKKDVKDFPIRIEEIEKVADEYIRLDVIERIAEEIKFSKNKKDFSLILVNGAGAFGHFLANLYIKGKKQFEAKTIHDSVLLLNRKLVSCFRGVGLQVIPIDPFNFCYFTSYGFDISNIWPLVMKTISTKQIPSLYGDIVPSIGVKGRLLAYEIFSGDELVFEIAKNWRPDSVIMATDVEGVFDKDPKIYKDAKLIKKVRKNTQISFSISETDVSGGFEKKIIKLLSLTKYGIVSQIINGLVKGNVKKALLGDKTIGSLVLP